MPASKPFLFGKELVSGLACLLFPRLCAGCGASLVAGEEVICLYCEVYLAETGFHNQIVNETALRLAGRFPFEHATSYGYFTKDGLLQHLLHELKYRGRQANGIFLGRRLGHMIAGAGWSPDGIVPVPLHRRKQADRGFNQSELIAEGIAGVLQIPVLRKVVVRSRFTDSQTDKSREDRVANVAGAFRLTDPGQIGGRHLLLTDDVLTTGATLEACARALLSAPGVRVSIATAGVAAG